MQENPTPPHERHCPSCGAIVAAEARFCSACGMEMLPEETQPVEAPVETPTSAAPAAPAAEPAVEVAEAISDESQAEATGGHVCPWCGARSPETAARCVACDAVFPTPEGDEALERAARARIQAMESDLQQRRSGWWPFRSR